MSDLGQHARAVRRSLNGEHPGELGTMLPPLIDHHVHLQLGDADRWLAGGIAGVVDLGGDPAAVATIAAGRHLPHVHFAGAFLTAPGGYPSGRPWCPPGAVREVPTTTDAATARHAHDALPGAVELAVAEQARFGASVIKVALNADAGPLVDAATLAAIVAAAHERGLPVGAHAQGAGMAALAIEAGADALVHAPWSERLSDAIVQRAASAGQVWISTLAIHIRDAPDAAAVAIDNVRRFRAAGGRVIYGTDLGNGDLVDGVNPTELAALVRAGIEASDLIDALVDLWPEPTTPGVVPRHPHGFGRVPISEYDPRNATEARSGGASWTRGIATFVPGPPPTTLDALPGWLATARVVPIEELELL